MCVHGSACACGCVGADGDVCVLCMHAWLGGLNKSELWFPTNAATFKSSSSSLFPGLYLFNHFLKLSSNYLIYSLVQLAEELLATCEVHSSDPNMLKFFLLVNSHFSLLSLQLLVVSHSRYLITLEDYLDKMKMVERRLICPLRLSNCIYVSFFSSYWHEHWLNGFLE